MSSPRSFQRVLILASLAAGLGVGMRPAVAVTMNMVEVGDKGNAPDANGFGAVDYRFWIGKYEVTIQQYTDFLNAVGATDTYSLYKPEMATDLNMAGITRSGSSGSYSYSVMTNGGSSGNRPVTNVSWFAAARFANWMSNGQPIGAQDSTTTENGAYNLVGTGDVAPAVNQINPNTGNGPLFRLPTRNEWYKAAFYKGSGTNSGYWDYATQSDTLPGNVIGSGTNQVNYRAGSVYSVTQSGSYSESQNYLTDVGSFTNSASAYGTYDQSGNTEEWNDLTGAPDIYRGVSGGYWNSPSDGYSVSSANLSSNDAWYGYGPIGFRLASSVPEIDPAGFGSVAALITGALGLIERRRLKAKVA